MVGITFVYVRSIYHLDQFRSMWTSYCTNCNGLMFVVDSSDTERVKEAREGNESICSLIDICRIVSLIGRERNATYRW